MRRSRGHQTGKILPETGISDTDKGVFMRRAIAVFLLLFAFNAYAEDNSTLTRPSPNQAKPAAETPKAGTGSLIADKLPLDILAKGTDQSGTLLSYKMKEELMASKLFALTASEKKKFVLHLQTRPEFPDRPGIASQYSIALVYQEDAGSLSYYLDQMQGQVHSESVTAEMQKILEWSYSTVKKYRYLLEE